MRFILELRVADPSDRAPVVQTWILDTDVPQDSMADFIVPFAAPKSGHMGALGDFVEQVNRAVGVFTDPCNAMEYYRSIPRRITQDQKCQCGFERGTDDCTCDGLGAVP